MLELDHVSIPPPGGNQDVLLLDRVNLHFHLGQLGAIVGPSGCGKSTLLKSIAGLLEPVDGTLYWRGRDLDKDEDFHPSELGYVPQFSIYHHRLTVREAVINATRLRTTFKFRNVSAREWANQILEQVGLADIGDRRTEVLSGGQMRRLGLALELVTQPSLLLCDEVTSGLDPKSENEIVSLLRSLADDRQRLVLSVTHSLRHLESYDTVTVLMAGRLIFHGPSDHLLAFFQVSIPEDVFPAIAAESVEHWVERLEMYQPYEESSVQNPAAEGHMETYVEIPEEGERVQTANQEDPAKIKLPDPGMVAQSLVLIFRRFKLFFRDPAQVGLQSALILIFPILVVLFAYEGLPEIRNMSMELDQDLIRELQDKLQYAIQSSRVGSLVSGLVMFQVILLTLMGANNAAREVANERPIFEKEKLSGVRNGAVLISKLVFLLPLVAAQSFWMAYFVKNICDIPGSIQTQWTMLFLVTGAMTLISLAISSWARTSEQASLVSIYLVGFQLPLSGTVLALPEFLAPLVRPFISAYWAWSGYLQALRETRFYDLVRQITQTPVANADVATFVLSVHLCLALFLAWLGLARSQWR